MANQERKLKNNVDTLEKEIVSRLVNINRQAGKPRGNKLAIEKLNKEYFGKLRTLLGTS